MEQIKKGDRFRCIKNIGVANAGNIPYFIEGKIYECVCPATLTDERRVVCYLDNWCIDFIKTFEKLPPEPNSFELENEIQESRERITTPPYYNNDNGSLYKTAHERGWNAYLFDVVKRLERGGKKDPLSQEIDKSIAVLQLWKKEQTNESESIK